MGKRSFTLRRLTTHAVVKTASNVLEDTALVRIRMLLQVFLLVLLMLLALAMLLQLLLALEELIARNAFGELFCDRAGVGSDHLGAFLVENVLGDGRQLGHSSLGVVDVELSRQVQLVIDYLVKADVASRADDRPRLLFNLAVHICRVFCLLFCFKYIKIWQQIDVVF